MTSCGLVYDECFLEHSTGWGAMSAPPFEGLAHQTPHPECPERIANVKALLDYTGLMQQLVAIAPDLPDRGLVELVHSKEHVDRIRDFCGRGGGRYDDYTPMGPKSYDIALRAAGGCVKALDWILGGKITNAYALVRPPGHHATRHQAMGFCLFNNIAVAAAYAKTRRSVGKILILDWDVHHGNGTQSIFYEDPSVLFISIHQARHYPVDSGTVAEDGQGPGRGFTINIPLSAGTGDRGYLHAMQQIVAPICRQFQPDLILVSAGQDAAIYDPFGRNGVTYHGFGAMTALVKDLAGEFCAGRLLMVQEGGYNIIYQPFAVLTMLEILTGQATAIEKPWGRKKYCEPDRYLKDIASVIDHHKTYWKL